MSWRGCLALLSLVAAVDAAAQVKEVVTVTLIEVPVTVVDGKGRPIRGLKPENFEILDEGKRRTVTSFDAVDFSSTGSLSALSPLNPAARRNFLLVFDLSFSSPGSISRAQAAARNFVATTLTARDRVGVATVDVAHGFKLLVAFTTDRGIIEAAIAAPENFRGFDPLHVAMNPSFDDVDSMGEMQATSNGRAAEADSTKEIHDRFELAEDEYRRQAANRQIGLLGGLATTLRSAKGQKHIILLSEGFEARLVQGRDANVTKKQIDDHYAVEHGRFWQVDSDSRFGSAESLSIVERMSQAARRSDVIIDAIDIRGVRGYSDAKSGNKPQSNEALHLLAGVTGGTVFQNTNDLSNDFDRVMKANEVVYVLGFQAPSTVGGGFHNLRVRLIDVPGGRATSRAGYYDGGSETPAERSLSNAEVILNDIPQTGIHVSALATPFATTAENDQVPVVLEIDGHDLVAAAREGIATAEMFVYAFDGSGSVRDSQFQRVTLDLARVREALLGSGVKYYTTLSLPPGKFAVKCLVRVGESESRGFVRLDVEVPSSGTLSVSRPIFFDGERRWLLVKGGSHDRTNAPYPFVIGGESFIPSIAMRGPLPMKFVVFAGGAFPDDLEVSTAPVATEVSRSRSREGTTFVFQLDGISNIASSLSVTVRKRGSTDLRQSVIPLSPQ